MGTNWKVLSSMSDLINSLCIIVPCYNEQNRINLDEILVFQSKLDCLVLFVDDGSKDETNIMLDKFCSTHKNFELLSLPRNVGKARATFKGISEAKERGYTLIGTYDADSAVGIEDYLVAKDLLVTRPEIDLVSGARILLAGSGITRNNARRWISRIVATYVNSIIRQDFYDPQSPCKIFRKSLVSTSSKPKTRWFLDVELILDKRDENHDTRFKDVSILEFPLKNWTDVEHSKVNSGQFFRILRDLFELGRRRYFHKNKPGTKRY